MIDINFNQTTDNEDRHIRILLDRKDDKINYIEMITDNFENKRIKHSYNLIELSNEQLKKIRDSLNSLNL